MKLTGVWFPANSASSYDASLSLDASKMYLLSHSEQKIPGDVEGLSFSDRIGNIPRKITLADGSIFQTNDNDSVDEWLKGNDHNDAKSGWIHSLETNLRWISAALVFTILIGFVAIKYGLPWASNSIAHKLPPSTSIAMSNGTLKTLDKYILKPTQMSEAKQAEIQARFKKLVSTTTQEGFEYELLFRKMRNTANAFALPSGSIVVTDRLIEIVTNPDEFDAILLHEIGHITQRHSMRQVIQSSALTVAVVMWTGDTSAIDEWATALPIFLMQSSYSQGFETESDVYAFERMIELGIDPIHFGNGLNRITNDAYKDDPKLKEASERMEKVAEYFSSHPSTEGRAKLSQEYSERFKQQTR